MVPLFFVRALDLLFRPSMWNGKAYYSGTFLETMFTNACRLDSQVKSSVKMHYLQLKKKTQFCKAIFDTAKRICPTHSTQAEKVCRNFTLVFTTFSKCHNIYNRGDQLPEDDIHTDTLGR